MSYPWYELVKTGDLQQGDLLFECPTLTAVYAGLARVPEVKGKIEIRDLAVLTQSCDLVNDKVEMVLLCPIHSIKEAIETIPDLKGREYREALRKGNLPGLHLLEEINFRIEAGIEHPLLVVNFTTSITLPYNYLKEFILDKGPRPRLLPPYREHLAQAFARYYMRVGLPTNIDPAKLSKSVLGL